jgi:hypothetical protein
LDAVVHPIPIRVPVGVRQSLHELESDKDEEHHPNGREAIQGGQQVTTTDEHQGQDDHRDRHQGRKKGVVSDRVARIPERAVEGKRPCDGAEM